jgi:hypothetical protein
MPTISATQLLVRLGGHHLFHHSTGVSRRVGLKLD